MTTTAKTMTASLLLLAFAAAGAEAECNGLCPHCCPPAQRQTAGSPGAVYRIGDGDFDADPRGVREDFAAKIRSADFSVEYTPLADLIKANGFRGGLREHKRQREGYSPVAYLDSSGSPIIGIGSSIRTSCLVQEMLLEMGVLTRSDLEDLRRFDSWTNKDKQRWCAKVRISDQQAQKLFEATLDEAMETARKVFAEGVWVKNDDGSCTWNAYMEDARQWNAQPVLARAVCVDLAFNTGERGLRSYAKFLMALKKHDYRRAGIELVDSRDAANHPGLYIRRMDAAIELFKLAGEN